MAVTSPKVNSLSGIYCFLFFWNIYFKEHLRAAALKPVLIISEIELAPD